MRKLIESYKRYRELVKLGLVKKYSFISPSYYIYSLYCKLFKKCKNCIYYNDGRFDEIECFGCVDGFNYTKKTDNK